MRLILKLFSISLREMFNKFEILLTRVFLHATSTGRHIIECSIQCEPKKRGSKFVIISHNSGKKHTQFK